MNFNEFQKILDEDMKKPYGEERMDVVLDFEPAVYYDKLLNTYWYCDEDDEVLEEVELVGQLHYDCFDRNRLCAGMDDEEDLGDYLTYLMDNIFCGEEAEGRDWLWFNSVDKNNKTAPLERVRYFY